MKNFDLITILGCTATGKTALATKFAAQLDGEVISADSRQVYRGMDVGTGKDLDEFDVDGKIIPYHLIDIIDAGEEYNVYQYQKDFLKAYEDIKQRGVQAILCGGTGLYLEAVLKGYRFVPVPDDMALRAELGGLSDQELVTKLKGLKELHNTTDSIHRDRIIRAIEVAKFERENEAMINDFPSINHRIFGIDLDRAVIRDKITARLKQRMDNQDMIGEVERLLNEGVPADRLKFYGLEYKLITMHLQGELTKQELFVNLNTAIHQFAKRQATWFRKMEKNGIKITWVDGTLSMKEKVNFIQQHLA